MKYILCLACCTMDLSCVRRYPGLMCEGPLLRADRGATSCHESPAFSTICLMPAIRAYKMRVIEPEYRTHSMAALSGRNHLRSRTASSFICTFAGDEQRLKDGKRMQEEAALVTERAALHRAR